MFMEKILITRVSGFFGFYVASQFLRDGYWVVGVDDLSSGHIENVPAGIGFVQGNLAQASTVAKVPRDCRNILHLAGRSGIFPGVSAFKNCLPLTLFTRVDVGLKKFVDWTRNFQNCAYSSEK
jgi:nucleoside-diphosphate-sugar epimerase